MGDHRLNARDLRHGDRVSVRSYSQWGMAIVSGVVTDLAEDKVCVRADLEYPNAGHEGVVWAWYTDVLPQR